MVWDSLLWASDALRPYDPVLTVVVGAVIAVCVWCADLRVKRNRKNHIKKAIIGNMRDLADIFENINLRAERVEEDDYDAEIASAYFSRKTVRMEMLRINVENMLVQLEPGDDFVKKARAVLEFEAWLMDTYNDQTSSPARRVNLWKADGGELEVRVRKAIKVVQTL